MSMKIGRILMVAGVFSAVALQALAQEEQYAYSANAVGVIRKTIPAGKQVVVSLPLDQDSDDGTGFVFGQVPAFLSMPNGSQVSFWDVTEQRWILQAKSQKSGWGTQKNRRVVPGESFFLKNNGATNIDLVFCGEVPLDLQISRTLPEEALQVAANPYPVSMVFTNFAFADALPNGSQASFWNVEEQRWVLQAKSQKSGWGTQKNREVAPGEGFFIKSKGAYEWSETRPYTWSN